MIIIMFKYLFSSQYRSVYSKLQSLGVLSSNKNNTKFNELCTIFIGKPNVEIFINKTFEIIYQQKINIVKCIKMLAFVHCALILVKDLSNIDNITKFLSFLLKYSYQAEKDHINTYGKFQLSHQVKQNSNKHALQFTVTQHTSRSNNLDDSEKKLFLIRNTIRPYLSYLLKITSNYEFYWQCKSKKQFGFQQCWKIINFFKSVESIGINFVNVGRYFEKQYENIIILLCQLMSRDIIRFYNKMKTVLKDSATLIQYQFSIISQKYTAFDLYDHLDIDGLDDTVRIFEQLATLNESLHNFYINKYFKKSLEHLEQPDWLRTSRNEYDLLFHLWKIKQRVNQQKKKKGLKTTDPLFSLIKNGDISNKQFSFSLTNPEDYKKQ